MAGGGQVSSKLEVVGRILGVHGIQGWVKVYSYTDPMDNLQQYQPWHLKQGGHWEDTIIVFTSDHGEIARAHGV